MMTFEFRAVRIHDDGRREDCIVTVKNDGLSKWESITLREWVDRVVVKFPDVAVGCKIRRGQSWDGDEAMFFTIIYPKGSENRKEFFARLQELQTELSNASRGFEPDLFAYMDIEVEPQEVKVA